MIDRDTWIILAHRCATISRLRAEPDQPDVELVFDNHDQARVVPASGQQNRSVIGSKAVPSRVSP